jgi:lysophospholipase L1-like esterase
LNDSRYTAYVALGDSISIDLYPGLDLEEKALTVPPRPEEGPWSGLGAASLLWRNRDDVFPGFQGRDLERLLALRPEQFSNLATDGATCQNVLDHQLPSVWPSKERTLVTITAGGNDLLQNLFGSEPAEQHPLLVSSIETRLRRIVRRVKQVRPNSTILLSTIYDPSDGTNRLPVGEGEGLFVEEGTILSETNEAIRRIATGEGIRLADIHAHFLGHGWQTSESWYWNELVFEPGFRGASEVRRVWLQAIHEIDEEKASHSPE